MLETNKYYCSKLYKLPTKMQFHQLHRKIFFCLTLRNMTIILVNNEKASGSIRS